MTSSNKVVYAGIAANALAAVAKLAVAAITGSTSMLAEGFHSVVDTGNTLLLLLGTSRSMRPADEDHPFGHGKELYFWSFVVAVSMFSVGGVLSIWEGVQHYRHPSPLEDPTWSYIILGVSTVINAASLIVAVKEIYQRKGQQGLVEYIGSSKDPTVVTVFLEDASDILGQVIAFVAIFLSARFHDSRFDAVGSIAIGLTILAVSVVLANESRGLLIGEGASAHEVQRIKDRLINDPDVEHVGKLLTMQLGPNEILVNAEIDFHPQGSLEALEETIERIEREVRQENPAVRHLYLEATSLQKQKPSRQKNS